MRNVVITGSTRGIGHGLAEAFLQAACAVMVSGRTQAAVDQATTSLAARLGAEHVAGQACDVTVFEQVQALWAAAQSRWERVNIWINNAGLAHCDIPMWELPPEHIRSIVETNITGLVFGNHVAAAGVQAQGPALFAAWKGSAAPGKRGGAWGPTAAPRRPFTTSPACWPPTWKGRR